MWSVKYFPNGRFSKLMSFNLLRSALVIVRSIVASIKVLFCTVKKRKKGHGVFKKLVMSLNDVRLTPQLLTDLYGNILVETGENTSPGSGLKTLGENAKKILIVVKNEGEAVLPENELTFLSSILSACKLTIADVVILNWNHVAEKDYKAILHQLES